MDKTSSGWAKRRYTQQLKWNSNLQDTQDKKCNLQFLSKLVFFLVVLSCWKRNTFQISIKFDLKNWKTYFEYLISPSFDELHCSTIVHMNHISVWRIFVFVFVFANISPNIHIRIRIRPFLSPRIYSYLYSPFFINPNIFVFVFVLDMDTEYISICISLHKFNQIP